MRHTPVLNENGTSSQTKPILFAWTGFALGIFGCLGLEFASAWIIAEIAVRWQSFKYCSYLMPASLPLILLIAYFLKRKNRILAACFLATALPIWLVVTTSVFVLSPFDNTY